MSKRRKMLHRKRVALVAKLTGHQPTKRSAMADGVRLRNAGPADVERIRGLCELADVTLETPVERAIEAGHAGTALQVGQTRGLPAFFDDVKETLPELTDDTLRELFLRLTHVVVAEHDQAGVIGTAVVFPPAGTIMRQVQWMQQAGTPSKTQMTTIMSGALRVTRIKAVAVDPGFRRAGIGASLVEAGVAPFVQLGYSMIYGIMPPRRGLETFYSRQGFEVLPVGSPLSLNPVEIPAGIQAGPDERIFVRYL